MSNEATVAAGIICKRSVSAQRPVESNDLSFSAANFAFKMWGSAVDVRVIVLIDNANAFNAWLVSRLIFVHDS